MSDRKETVSYIVFEGEMTRMERTNHRLWIFCILLLLTLIGTNAGWLYYESQFTYVTETTQKITQSADADNGGEIRLIGGDYYGESDTNNQDNN